MRSLWAGARVPLVAAFASAGAAAALVLAAVAPAAAAPPGPAAHVAPGAVSTSGSGAHLFYTATDGSVWTTDAGTGGQGSPQPLGGRLVSAPAAIWTGGTGGEVIVFGQGTDDELWETETTSYPAGWSPWQPLGGVLTSKPGAADADATTFSVFARGTDGAVWERDHSGTAWDSWHSIGGQVLAGTGPGAAYTVGYQQTWVAVTGTDRAVWYLNLSSNIPQNGWASLGGRTTAGPALAPPGATPAGTGPAGSALAAFVRGANGAGFCNEIIGGAQGWHSIGGALTSGLAASTDGSGVTWVSGLGTDNRMYADSGTFPAFSGWTYVPA